MLKKAHRHLLFLFFSKKMQLPTAAQRVHIIRASTHKNSEVKGGIRSPPDFTSKREREESPTAVCATAGSKVIEEPDIEP